MKIPPKWLSKLLKQCTPHDRIDVLGDFEEWYDRLCEEKGKKRAVLILLFNGLSMLRLSIFTHSNDKLLHMTNRLSFKIAIRNLRKNKSYALINVLGLGVGLAACTLIGMFIEDELSYDTHFEEYQRVYRIANELDQGGDARTQTTFTPFLLAPTLQSNLDSNAIYTRMDFMELFVEVGEQDFWEDHAVAVDANFFQVFGVPFHHGDIRTALDDPRDIVLDLSTATKYFPEESAMGKELEVNGTTYRISGIIADLPDPTHFEANVFFSIASVKDQYPHWMTNTWGGVSHRTYFKVPENYDVNQLEANLNQLIAAHVQNEKPPGYFFQPLKDIHLTSDLVGEIQANGSFQTLYIFLATAIVILLLACINFINLSVAGAMDRLQEIGVKKVFGASKASQIWQFQLESLLLGMVASGLAVFFVECALPVFNTVTGKQLLLSWQMDGVLFAACLVGISVISLFAGSFPALFLLKTPSSQALKGTLVSQRKTAINPRNVWVGIQFFLAAILISSTLVILKQLHYMQEKDLGINTDQLIVAPFSSDEAVQNYPLFKEKLLSESTVLDVTASTSSLTGRVGGWRQYRTSNRTEDVNIPTVVVDHDFFATIDAEFVEGRSFSRAFRSDDTEAYILNEAAVDFLDLKEPIGEKLIGSAFTGQEWSSKEARIIGVAKDFHFSSLHDKIRPVAFSLSSEITIPLRYVLIKVKPDDLMETLNKMEEQWNEVNPNQPFRYQFVDEVIEEHYLREIQFMRVFSVFSILSLFIGSLGLFGLTAFTMKRRVKEIGIRKVLGANQLGLIGVLSVDFIRLVVIASLLGTPVTIGLMMNWLSGFEYRISISGWIFVVTILGSIFIGMASILYHSLKVAKTNPVDSIHPFRSSI